MPESPNIDPPDTPEGRLDKLEARLGRLDATDEKVAVLEGRLARVDETDEKVSELERRLMKLDEIEQRLGDQHHGDPAPLPSLPERVAADLLPDPPLDPPLDPKPQWHWPQDLSKREKRRRG